jgi:hypothetical protein
MRSCADGGGPRIAAERSDHGRGAAQLQHTERELEARIEPLAVEFDGRSTGEAALHTGWQRAAEARQRGLDPFPRA